MSYENTTTHDLYMTLQSGPSADAWVLAVDWVDAENIMAVWQVVISWFRLMQSGEAAYRYPDPLWEQKPGRQALTPKVADQIIAAMDSDFGLERNRFPRETGLGPDFSRLPPHARMAMAQELYDTIKTMAEIQAEAKQRLAAGEEIPPAQS